MPNVHLSRQRTVRDDRGKREKEKKRKGEKEKKRKLTIFPVLTVS